MTRLFLTPILLVMPLIAGAAHAQSLPILGPLTLPNIDINVDATSDAPLIDLQVTVGDLPIVSDNLIGNDPLSMHLELDLPATIDAALPNGLPLIGGLLKNTPPPNEPRRELEPQDAPAGFDLDWQDRLVMRGEVIALSPSPEMLARAELTGFTVLRSNALGELGLDLIVLSAPPMMSTRDALAQLRVLDPAGTYDFNHLYFGASEQPGLGASAVSLQDHKRGGRAAAIGLIDGAVDTTHPALATARITSKSFAGRSSPGMHGTAIASILVGRDGAFTGVAPGARLYAADVFGALPQGGSTEHIIRALEWLRGRDVRVINISVVGPRNETLAAVIRSLVARDVMIVAAVGNDGPAAPPLYPASYPGVVGVTALDARGKVLPEAGRGAQVKFAALGVDFMAARPGGDYTPVRGTSFAAPIVAGLLALSLSRMSAREAERDLARGAVDLGAKGQDPIYGLGAVLVGNREGGATALVSAGARKQRIAGSRP